MKEKFLHSVTVNKILIASYCGLLIFVAMIRFIEYKQARKAARKINAISKTANEKLEQLVSISQGYAYEQKVIFPYIHNTFKKTKQTDNVTNSLGIPVYKDNLSAYQKNITTDTERKVFDQLLIFDEMTRQVNDSFLLLAAESNPQKQIIEQLTEKKTDASTNFNAAIYQLLDIGSKESKLEIAETSKHIMALAKRRELSSYFVIVLLLLLGLSIGNTLRKLRRTENKYRLLFEISPLPNFIVDSKTFRYLKVNDAAVRLYGFSREEFLNMGAFDLRRITNKDQQENLKAKWKELIEVGTKQHTIKARHYKKNGEILDVEVNAKVFFLNRKVFFLTINDITEREKLDKKITKAIIKTQEDERRKLGSELHDNVGQILASTQLFLSMVVKGDQEKKEKYLAETRKYLAMAMNEIRDISHRVYPAFLEQTSFPDAINNLLEEMNPERNLSILFEYDRGLLTEFIHPDIKLNIYRILQEQLKNIQKYSKATEVNIELRTKNNRILLKITDNGIGFDSKKIKPGIGLMNIKKRAELFSGKYLLETAPQKGCSITVDIPLLPEKAV